MARYPYALAICFITSCSGEPPRPSAPTTPVDASIALLDAGTVVDARVIDPPIRLPKCDPKKEFGAPVLLTGLGAGSYTTLDVVGDEMVVTQGYVSDKTKTKLVFAQRNQSPGSPWTAASGNALAPASDGGSLVGFFDPSITEDGKTMYFASGTQGVAKIYTASRETVGQPFREPKVVTLSNHFNDATGPRFRRYGDKEELCFATNGHIWCTLRSVGAPQWPAATQQTLGEDGGAANEGTPVMSFDGKSMYFTYISEDKMAQIVKVAYRDTIGGPWSDIQKLESVDSPKSEQPVWISDNGCTLYITSTRSSLNIWELFVTTRNP